MIVNNSYNDEFKNMRGAINYNESEPLRMESIF